MANSTNKKKIFITGVNGFIGSHLLERLIDSGECEIFGLDIDGSNVAQFLGDRFDFVRADMADAEAIVRGIKWSDVVLPLAGVARPAFYISHPLKTFELDFELNLRVVRFCAEYGKRVIFPSTSEVYGMCGDDELCEDTSPLTTGPIREMRWIYSTSKQMMDRVIFAYGAEMGLRFTLFRPFNWTGPRLDTFEAARHHEARAITQMIFDVIDRGAITLVGGGEQRRSFTWIGDGIDALDRIIADDGEKTNGEIINIGAPMNNRSIRDLADLVIREMRESKKFSAAASKASVVVEDAEKYYGPSYADTRNRVPSVAKAERLLGWTPTTAMEEIVRRTVAYYDERD